jgi:hypothetical protein
MKIIMLIMAVGWAGGPHTIDGWLSIEACERARVIVEAGFMKALSNLRDRPAVRKGSVSTACVKVML